MQLIISSMSELTRAEKKPMYNCFTTSADINLFADTLQITVTLTSTKSASCDIPHGVFVSLQIDSLGSYEPSAYVQDFVYDSPQQIRLACTDPVECAKLKAAESGTVVLETKTHATFVPAGSIRVSKGLSSSCFHDNDSFVELYQGAVVLVLYPTFTCKDQIATDNLGQLKLNTLSKVKIYITYTDNSISIHDQLAITIQQDLFVPTLKVTASSTPVRIKLENPTISKYFIQTMTNGVLSKDAMLFQINMQYVYNSIIHNAQVTTNFYEYPGLQNVFSELDLQILNNGFLTQQKLGPSAAAANQLITDLQVTHYSYQYLLTTYDVSKTEQFSMRLFGLEHTYILFGEASFQNTCEASFPGQQCDKLLFKLNQMHLDELYLSLNFVFYKNDQVKINYTKIIDNIRGSCFSTGQITVKNRTAEIKFKHQAKQCSLSKNDAVEAKIIVRGQIVQVENLDYLPGEQAFTLQGVDLEDTPEIRVQFFKEGRITDAIAISQYEVQKDNTLLSKQIYVVLIILAAHVGVLLVYVLMTYLVQNIKKRTPKQQIKFIKMADETELDL
ncbi:Conserved_hypothetical protein [Hexamita inflata]|uniref:Uncharacterized protein n=1 Tax=Hexamita inflata TaxID=28002 RepID=A0AA86RPB6_9EUKA|nr:Conserved hypothetical protein [Hexamita inflata]